MSNGTTFYFLAHTYSHGDKTSDKKCTDSKAISMAQKYNVQ